MILVAKVKGGLVELVSGVLGFLLVRTVITRANRLQESARNALKPNVQESRFQKDEPLPLPIALDRRINFPAEPSLRGSLQTDAY